MKLPETHVVYARIIEPQEGYTISDHSKPGENKLIRKHHNIQKRAIHNMLGNAVSGLFGSKANKDIIEHEYSYIYLYRESEDNFFLQHGSWHEKNLDGLFESLNRNAWSKKITFREKYLVTEIDEYTFESKVIWRKGRFTGQVEPSSYKQTIEDRELETVKEIQPLIYTFNPYGNKLTLTYKSSVSNEVEVELPNFQVKNVKGEFIVNEIYTRYTLLQHSEFGRT